LPDSCIPLTVTSPPYDDLRDYDGDTFDFEAVAAELWRITMEGGVVVWVVGEQVVDGSETGTAARQKLHFMDLGFRCSTMIMATSRVRYPQQVRYVSVFDYAFVLSKGRPRHVNVIRDKPNRWAGHVYNRQHFRGRDGTLIAKPRHAAMTIGAFGDRSNVWYCHVGGGKTTTDDIDHPALMAEKMAEDHIVSWSRPGDLVFDLFAGGGTTCKMAFFNNRRYLGMEVCEKYVLDARRRLERAKLEQKRRLDALFFGDEIENRLGGKANGQEFDETAADDVPHVRCLFCGRRNPI
jgi:site-specific DNA-methyltransferase (adenine-specific)